MAGLAELMERVRAGGAMRDVAMAFVSATINSLAEATMDFMVLDRANAKKHCKVGFEAAWRALA